MKKLLAVCAALAAITFSMAQAQAQGVSLAGCDEDSIADCVRQFMPKAGLPKMALPKGLPRGMPMLDDDDAPAMPSARPGMPGVPPKTMLKPPAKLGGPKDLCKKYLAGIGQMVDIPCPN